MWSRNNETERQDKEKSLRKEEVDRKRRKETDKWRDWESAVREGDAATGKADERKWWWRKKKKGERG